MDGLPVADVDLCKFFCGGVYSSLIVAETGPSNDLFAEPSCNLTRKCNDSRNNNRSEPMMLMLCPLSRSSLSLSS